MDAWICRVIVLLVMALPGSRSALGTVARLGGEAEPAHESQTEESVAEFEALPDGGRESSRRQRGMSGRPRHMRIGCSGRMWDAYHLPPVRFWSGHRLPNGLNAPLLA